MLSIYGRSYLICLIIGIQIGANFPGERCKMYFKTIKNHYKVIFLFADVFEKITPNLVKPLGMFYKFYFFKSRSRMNNS